MDLSLILPMATGAVLPMARVTLEWTGCDRLLVDAISVETLRHCRLAVQHGVAGAFC